MIKIEISLAAILTVIAIVVWGVFFSQNSKSKDPQSEVQQNQNDGSIKAYFQFEFQDKEISLTNDQEYILNVNTKSISIDVQAAEAILVFDPTLFQVVKVQNGSLFDTYVGEEIDNEKGFVRLSGAFSDKGTNVDGLFASVTIKRISEGLGTISIRGSESSEELKSKVSLSGSKTEIYIDGNSVSVN